jgi:hypothetical protein
VAETSSLELDAIKRLIVVETSTASRLGELEPVALDPSVEKALFDHHGRVRPAWHAFRLLGQLEGPRYAVEGEQGNLRAIAGDGDGYTHLIVWRYDDGGPDEIEVRLHLGKGVDTVYTCDCSYDYVKINASYLT